MTIIYTHKVYANRPQCTFIIINLQTTKCPNPISKIINCWGYRISEKETYLDGANIFLTTCSKTKSTLKHLCCKSGAPCFQNPDCVELNNNYYLLRMM